MASTNQLHIEELRSILEKEQKRSISIDEANDIGNSLITFFEVLAKKVYFDMDDWFSVSKEAENSLMG